MTFKQVSRNISHTFFDGKKLKTETHNYGYTLWYEGDSLVEVRNGFNFICEPNSEAWEFFNKN